MSTPAILIIPLVHYLGHKAEHPRVKAVLQAVVLASSGLLLSATVALARSTVNDWVAAALNDGEAFEIIQLLQEAGERGPYTTARVGSTGTAE